MIDAPANPIRVEEGDDERSIATPDLRLRFLRAGDRWRHAIDLGPGPWQPTAESIDEEEAGLVVPTYQEIFFDRRGDAVAALAVGQAGPHHFSASFRVSFRPFRRVHPTMPSIVQDRSISLVEVDVADRTRLQEPPEARYLVRWPPIVTHLGDSDDGRGGPGGISPKWRSGLTWETSIPDSYDVAVRADGPVATRVSCAGREPGGAHLVRVAPESPGDRGTHRLGYAWSHHRVRVVDRADDPGALPPWSLAGCVGPVEPERPGPEGRA